jgi:hypothetical protein
MACPQPSGWGKESLARPFLAVGVQKGAFSLIAEDDERIRPSDTRPFRTTTTLPASDVHADDEQWWPLRTTCWLGPPTDPGLFDARRAIGGDVFDLELARGRALGPDEIIPAAFAAPDRIAARNVNIWPSRI